MMRRALAALALYLAALSAAPAADVRVFAAGAVLEALAEIAVAFEGRTGHRLTANFDAVGALRDRVLAGERPNIVILGDPALDALAAAGRIVPGSRRYLGQSGIALAARAGSAPLDVATPEKLRDVLLATPSIAFGDPARGNSAGAQFQRIIDQLGIAGAVLARAKVTPSGIDGLRAVVAGEVELGVGQAAEIANNRRLALVAMIPDSLQLMTAYGIAAVGPVEGATAELLDFLASPVAVEAFRRIGFAR